MVRTTRPSRKSTAAPAIVPTHRPPSRSQLIVVTRIDGRPSRVPYAVPLREREDAAVVKALIGSPDAKRGVADLIEAGERADPHDVIAIFEEREDEAAREPLGRYRRCRAVVGESLQAGIRAEPHVVM